MGEYFCPCQCTHPHTELAEQSVQPSLNLILQYHSHVQNERLNSTEGSWDIELTCFTLPCSRTGGLITPSQVVQKQILEAFTLLHKSLSNYILRGLPFPGITTAFTVLFGQNSLTAALYYVRSSRSQTWWPLTGYSSSLLPKLLEMNKCWE